MWEVIESQVWKHKGGRRASTYGAVPWTSEAERADWTLTHNGWTLRNPHTGEVGVGRQPFDRREDAEAFALRIGKPSRLSIAD